MADLLIKNAHIYSPEDLGISDIAIENGKITQMGPGLTADAAEVLDAAGLVALPGIVETHAHMLLPFAGTQTMNDFYDGTYSGAFGGVTTLVDFADQQKGGSALQALASRLALAKQSAVDYALHITLTDINEETLKAIPLFIKKGCVSFKFYTTYSEGGLYVPPEDMEKAFWIIAESGGLATVHAERERTILEATEKLRRAGNTAMEYFPQSKPDDSEAEAVEQVVQLSQKTGCPALIRHLSSAKGVKLVLEAQKAGLSVYGETCPHYLYFTREVYSRPNAADFIVHPPIRGEKDREALWGALQTDAVFTIGTDDCAFYKRQKRVSDNFYEVPGGMPGIETRLPVLYELGVVKGRINHERFARLTASYPAQIYGLYPQKGTLQIGSDADILLLNPHAPGRITAAELHEKSDYTPFEGFETSAETAYVFRGGSCLVNHKTFLGERGQGRFISRGEPPKLEEIV